MASLKSFHHIASKLGVNNDQLVCKGAEFERLLQSKSLAGSSLSDMAKVVICLDLAAMCSGVELDVKTAVKYSGLKSPTYMQCRKTIENLLELNSCTVSVANLCLSLQCAEIQVLAERILMEYQSSSKMVIDLDLPQYACMAVYQACRINKVKVSKAKLIEKSRLKQTQWTKLDADWSKFVENRFGPTTKVKGRPSQQISKDEGTNYEAMDTDEPKISCNEPLEPTEPYEEWKKRVLSAAYKELDERGKSQKHTKVAVNSEPKPVLKIILRDQMKNKSQSPIKSQNDSKRIDVENVGKIANELAASPLRKSPRKTPLKFSPYKPNNAAKKPQGVRLLFPM